jgi:hypothetical protein
VATLEINVRAIVTATCVDENASGHIPGWEIYDSDALERDENNRITKARIRCDQNVTVEADSEIEAIEMAKEAATDIVVEGFQIDDLTLWVDEGIDVTLLAPVSAPSA